MATKYLFTTLLFSWFTFYASCQEIGDALSKISYKTGLTEGGSGETLTITVNWNGTEFSCDSTPNVVDTPYECAPLSESPGTRIPSIEYFIYVDWPRANSPLQITEFVLTDDVGTEYTIQQFCHPPQMQCTLDTAEGITAGSMPSCSQWGSKDSYDNIQLGSDTKFSALYVDIPIFGTRFANKVVEGGVRPPNLANIGIATGGGTSSLMTPVSIQWDSALYKCTDITPDAGGTPYNCTSLSDPLYCPAMSDFWMSIYNNIDTANFLVINEIWFEDETNTKYTFTENFCRDPSGPRGGSGTLCTDSTYIDFTYIVVGGNQFGTQFPRLVPFFVPDCVFDYPDAANSEDVTVGAGLSDGAVPQDSDFGWDVGQYGGPIAAECPLTGKPTSDPTFEPTRYPTADPTTEPTSEPTTEPTFDPTSDPTSDPTDDPTTDPTSADPTSVPTRNPSSSPSEPTEALPTTKQPTKYPTDQPTKEPPQAELITSKTVFWGIIAIVTFLVCFLCCILFICWRRRKKKKEKDEKKDQVDKSAKSHDKRKKAQPVPIASPADDSSESGEVAKQDTYQDYNAGAINSKLSEDFGQDEAKQEVELQATGAAIDKQVTLDGVTATGADVEAGNAAVLDVLTDGAKRDGTDGAGTGAKGSTAGAIQTVDSDNFEFNV